MKKTEFSQYEEEVIRLRRHFHQYPELALQEFQTSAFIQKYLEELGYQVRHVPPTGLIAEHPCMKNREKMVVLRAEMDALPVQELTGLDYASRNEGCMHACGHDMHTACLLGAMIMLNRHKEEIEGTIFGLFQPGEEVCPGGASLVLAEDPFADYQVIAVVGEHVGAEIPLGQLGFRPGKYMASGDEVRLTVKGKGGHGALPHNLNDPVVAAAALITALQQIVSRNADSRMPTVLSFGRVIAEGATNVIPSEVHIEGTFRTMDEAWRAKGKQRIREISAGIAIAYGVEVDVDIADGYPCVVNDEQLTEHARQLTMQMWGAENIQALDLRMTAEDFGYYTVRYPSLFYRLGTAGPDGTSGGGLHTGTFNPGEEALDQGVATMAALGISLLKQH